MTAIVGERLESYPRYVHLAKVTIRKFGSFPIDMLRYDRCMPNTETDSGLINISFERPRTEPLVVIVRQYSTVKFPPWTTARWQSFGCEIEPITSMEAGQFCKDFEAALAAKA
jgi:hypothetical protein